MDGDAAGRHEVLAGLAAMERCYALSDADSREAVVAAAGLVSAAQGLLLASVKNLDGRVDAVPEVAGDRSAPQRLPGHQDGRAAHPRLADDPIPCPADLTAVTDVDDPAA